MSYTDWLRELSKLPKTAEFCLTDVSERISAGNRVINFVITEAKGQDGTSRRGQTKEVCRPRMFVSVEGDLAEVIDHRIEITEPVAAIDKKFINECSWSLHEFYVMQSRLCESVLSSLTRKIAVISERSTALLESQLGDEVVKLVTQKLEGVDVGMASLKTLLISQITSRMMNDVIRPVRRKLPGREVGAKLNVLEFQENHELTWQLKQDDGEPMGLTITWKGIVLTWVRDHAVVSGAEEAVCVRDTFLFIANLPSFGQMIATRLAKIME